MSRAWQAAAASPFPANLVLGSARRAGPALRALGVDVPRFLELLRVRLRLDPRRGGGGGMPSGALILGLAIPMLMISGLLTGVLALTKDDPTLWIVFSQGFQMAFLGLMLLVHYVPMLMDPTDVALLAPLPVPDRTLFAARLAHVAVYAAGFPALFTLSAMVLPAFRQPPWAVFLVFPMLTFLSTALMVGLAAVCFGALLRLAGPARFQRATLVLQTVVLTVPLAITYSIGPLLERLPGGRLPEPLLGVLRLLPPASYAGLYRLCLGDVSRETLWASAISLALPPLLFALALRLAASHFAEALGGQLELYRGSTRDWRESWAARLCRPLSRSSAERAGSGFAGALAWREAYFLRQALPTIASFVCLGPLLSWSMGPVWGIPLAIGLLAMMIPILLEAIQYSQQADARWIAELRTAGSRRGFVHGAVFAVLVATFLPALVLTVPLLLLLHGWQELHRLLLALGLNALWVFFLARHMKLFHPFSQVPKIGEVNFHNLGILFASIPLPGVTTVLTWWWARHTTVSWIAIALLLPVAVWQFRRLRLLEPLPTPSPFE